ncbi:MULTISPECIES: hypothetical protein [unclassified Chelatococcus]|uniref:hypothetical protein n=1 Tax=unclassified Chelatococcus TaxID=2638111 RepID=UPI001BCDF25A|nr:MULTISPECIES: hypothetical protein [unclassified Chelatococcus]MBS7696259.1 hypothetical protein [Chelatococcus sp. YT9]MBS7741452.1 hypothetical protein [Chelatococcus sp. HY11]MBX3544528.1 hypothetical protein [Chelatococcus sp.]MCO5078950.1 hypothetical protein [Chelatococcus sp.]
MAKRGRVPAASLAVASIPTIETIERPDAPYDLTDEQADEWWAVVNRMPVDWFPRETHGMLAQYCRHVVRARRLAQLLNKLETSEDIDVKEYRDLLRSEEEQSRAISSLATRMRISQQATVRAEQARKPTTMKPPWQDV